MYKKTHEIRDPIHVFIRLDSEERKLLDCRALQRLRHIHQLGLSYLIYPGATHKRFEHSLGVMELATRIFDVITHSENVHPKVRDLMPEISDEEKRRYWRRVLRMAALYHDVGHLPFSHAAESSLLPDGWTHERLTGELIRNSTVKDILENMTPPLRPDDVVKLAVGPGVLENVSFTSWEAILSEIIVGDAFGADRMDYLLRDSHHAGVAYGKFDHYRLIDTLRILPQPEGPEGGASDEPALGTEEGGLHSAEALLLARYFMFTQVYHHPVRRIYDIHLRDFLQSWLPKGRFSTVLEDHLKTTDDEIVVAINKALEDHTHPSYDAASRIAWRRHFKLLYQRNPEDIRKNPEASRAVFEAAGHQFGRDSVRWDFFRQKGSMPNFPVLERDGRVLSSIARSETLRNLPVAAVDYVFISPELEDRAQAWLNLNRSDLIQPKEVK